MDNEITVAEFNAALAEIFADLLGRQEQLEPELATTLSENIEQLYED